MKDAIIAAAILAFVGIPFVAGVTTQRLANEEEVTLEGITQSTGAVVSDGLKTIFHRHQPQRLGPTVQEANEQIKEMDQNGQIRQIEGGADSNYNRKPNLGDRLRDLLPGGGDNRPYNQSQQLQQSDLAGRGSGRRNKPKQNPVQSPGSNWIE